MECGLCGTLNRDLARFCGGCGAPLGRVCVNCKSEIDAGLRFCDQCGTPVEGAEAPVAAAAGPAQSRTPDAVRKTVTVLFADLGGSTGFGERTDPEVSRQVLARYHALLQEAIDAHRGTVAKFMGDGMMATFGIPEVAEDDAERAVRAGIEIQDRFARFADDVESTFGERLTARVGVNTGEVVIGAADADLVGDALNVAARLEKACRPGHVLVGDETWRLTRGVLAYESLGEVTVAGRAQPVGTYEVATSERAAETVAPFVGRDSELARLVTAFDHARAERAAVLVTVIGSPGLGKTRLSRELAAHVSAEGDATTFEIRCDRSGGSTFAPVADLLREAAGLEVSEADDTVTHEKLGALIRDDGDRARVVDALAGVLGAAPARSVEETFWAVRRTMESLAADRPLLIVIDDIQWAESKLLDLIDHLAEWVTGVPLLLVGLARPELRDLRPAFVESGRRVSHVVALDGLDVRATEALAVGLLGSALPRELVERLPTSTDGNPLFVRELVRMLVDDGVIRRRDDGTWDLAIDADAVEVPPTIQSLLATRVERLPADELRLLELASVVGAEFSDGALHALGGDDLALPTLLERLRRKELVEPTGTYWGDEPLHRFHHVLIRDAAYRRLLKGARADLHRRVGEWTDATAKNVVGEHETTIAFHYEQAHRYRSELGVVDDETDRLGRRAADLLDVAARRAFDRDDLASAGVLASRALAVLPDADAETRAELLLMACECLLASGDVAAGAPLVDDLTGVGADDPKLAAWASCFHAQLVALTDPDRLVEAEGIATGAAETLQGLGDGAGEAKAHQVRALLLARLGRVGEAEAVLDLALGAARAADDRRRVTAVLGAAPQAALFGPSPVARAGGRCLDVVRLLRITTASPSVEATSMRCQAVLEALRGRFDVSRSMLASSRAALEELGLRHGLLETDLYAGIVELIAGDSAAAVGPLRAAYEGLGTLGVGADAGQAAALLATALLAQGETDEAELAAAESEALAGQNLKTAIAWRIAKASVLAARGAVTDGAALAQQAVEIASATDLVLDHADACVVLADLRDTAGDAAGARAARDEARRLYDAKGATVPAERLASAARQVAAPSPVPSSLVAAEPDDPRTPECENTTTRVVGRLAGYIGTDLAPPPDLVSDSFVLDDRRALIGLPGGGGDEIWANFSMMRDQGYRIEAPVPVAVRGERLALHRTTALTPSGDETALLSIDELDGDLRIASVTWFDDDDLLVAIAELERRYFYGEGAPYQRVLAAVGRYSAAYERHDLDGVGHQLAPDLVMVDHQPVSWGSGGRDLFLEMSHPGGVGVDGRGVNHVVYVNEHALLGLSTQALRSGEGSRYERSSCTVLGIDATDRINRVEIFAAEDFDAALAVLDELGAERPTASRSVENRASRLALTFARDLLAGRFDAAAHYVHEDLVRVDHTTKVSDPTLHGDDQFWRSVEASATVGYASFELEPLAVRGERLHMGRTTRRTSDGYEVVSLYVDEIDADGRCFYSALFDEDDVIAAVDDLDRRYIAGEGTADAVLLERAGTVMRAYDRHDWAALRSMLADDFVSDDHGTIGFGTVGADEFIDLCRVGLETMPDYMQICRSMTVDGLAGLATCDGSGTLHDGGRYEWTIHFLQQIDAAGKVRRIEWFDEDDLDAAMTRLRELGALPSAHPSLENAATRGTYRMLDLLRERRWDEARAHYSDEFVRVDRRAVVNEGTVAGPDSMIESLRVVFENSEGVTLDVLAVRGECLALVRIGFLTHGFESVVLQVRSFDADGRCAAIEIFDDDDLDAALAALDARFLAGEGAGSLPVLAAGVAWIEASRNRDVDALRAVVAPDLVCVDHQPLGFGTLDRDGIIAATQLRFDVSSDDVVIVRSVQVDGPVVLARHYAETATDEGSRYEREAIYVLRVDVDGRIDRWDVYGDDLYDAALARFHELGAPWTAPAIENEAARFMASLLVTANEPDVVLDENTDWSWVAQDVVRLDRRQLVAAPPIHDRDAFAANAAAFFEVFDTVDPEVVAVRGERLALIRLHCGRAPDFVLRILCLYEFDAGGHLVFEVDYDDDDLDAARRELDEHYVAGEGAPHDRVLRICRAFGDANDRRDFDAMQSMLASDFVMADHTRLGYGEGDRDYFDTSSRTVADVAIASAALPRMLQIDGDALLAVTEGHQVTPEGNDYVWVSCIVFVVGDDDLIHRAEYYDEADYATAVARMHELAIAPGRIGSLAIENAATRADARAATALARADRTTPDELALAEDFVLVDRRTVVALPDLTAEGLAENFSAMRAQGYTIQAPVPLAVRGQRLCLSRRVATTAAGDESPLLAITELDELGRWSTIVFFDEHALDAALDELEDRYVAGEGAEHEYLVRRVGDVQRASRRGDTEAYQSLYTEGCAVANHRAIGWPMASVEDVVAMAAATSAVVAERSPVFASIECRGDVVLVRQEDTFVTPEESRYATTTLVVARLAAGRFDVLESFDLDDEATARARFAELVADDLRPGVDNAAVRAVTRAYWLRRFVGPEAAGHLVSRDIAGEDRRHTVSMPEFHGRAGFAHAMDATDAVFSDGAEIVPLAVRGDRLVLVRDRLHHGDDELEVLNLWETDAAQRLVHATLFDPDDLARAVDTIEERHRALAGDAYTDFEWGMAIGEYTLNHRDFDAFAPMLAPGFHVVDHRQLTLPMDRDEYIESLRVLVDQAPDFTYFFAKPHIEGNIAITPVPFFGTTPEGSRYEWSYVQVMVGDREAVGALSFEFFDDDQWDEAVARFHELVAADSASTVDPRTPEPHNAAWRRFERVGELLFHDLESALEGFADDAVTVSRMHGPLHGASASGIGGLRTVLGSMVGTYTGIRTEPVAVRGEQLAVVRYELVADGFVTAAVAVVELAPTGLIRSLTSFDEADLADAIELLEERHRMVSGDSFTAIEGALARGERAFNRHDASALDDLFAPGLTVVDHRQLRLSMEREEYLESFRVLVEQLPDVTVVFSRLFVVGTVALGVVHSLRGSTTGGLEAEWAYVQLGEIDAEGRATRFEFFGLDQWTEALARFDEWSATSEPSGAWSARTTSSGLENAATRRIGEFLARLRAGDRNEIRAFIADGYRYVDHRFSGVSGGAEGFDEFMDQMRAYGDVGFREPTAEVLAIRGERFLLSRSENVSRDGYTSVELRIGEHDADGRFVRTDVYDDSDLARAVVDLNARYRDSGEATEAEMRALDDIDALNRRDWDTMKALLDPDLVAVDHQPLGFEPTGRDGFVADWMGGLVALMPDAVTVVAEVRGQGRAAFGRIVTRGDTVDGNEYGWDTIFVARLGTGARLEFFPLEQRTAALALLDEWGGVPAAGVPDNVAARTMVRWYGLSRAGDPAADALTMDDIAMVDRRRGVSLPMIEGRDAFNEAMVATDAVFREIDIRTLAVRGERLALINVLRSNDGFELSTLVLVEAATDGRVHRVVIFGESDLVASLEVLDRRHLTTADDLLPVEAHQLATYAALNRRDWSAFTAGLANDLEIVDHRRIGFPPGRGAAALAGELQGLVAQVPDVVAYVTAIRAHGRAALVTTHQHGTALVGGHATWDFHTVVKGDADGRVVSLEYFDEDRWDDAVTRFDEWSVEPARALGVTADGVSEAFARRDWDWIRTHITDDIELHDHRSTVSSHVASGADAVIELLRGFADVGFVSMRNEVVEARGDRLALFRRTYRTEASFELVMLAAAERNEAGLIVGMVLFDADDLDAATAELERRAADEPDR